MPAVIAIVIILFLFFAAFSFLSRGQVQGALHFLEASRILSAAEGAANWAVVALASGSYRSSPGIVQKKFYDTMFGAGLAEFQGEIDPPPDLKAYISELGADLTIRVKLFGMAPLPVLAPGFSPDPVEKAGRMEVTAVAGRGQVRRQVRIVRGFKVFQTVHPVLSKFTLFVRQKPADDELNALTRKSSGAGFENGAPLVLNNLGPGKAVSIVDPINLSALPPPADVFRDAGWVFLNGETAPWVLNLSGKGSTGEFDDRVLLRLGEYSRPDLDGPLLAGQDPAYTYLVKRITEIFQGMNADLTSRKSPTETEDIPVQQSVTLQFLFPTAPKVSLLRPFGTGSQFSPTLVFGPVQSRFLRIRHMYATIPGGPDLAPTPADAYLPGFPDLAAFKKAWNDHPFPYAGPPDPVKEAVTATLWTLQMLYNFNPSDLDFGWFRYSPSMTLVSTLPFLEHLDYLFLPERESGTVANPVGAPFQDPPPTRYLPPDLWPSAVDTVHKAVGAFGPPGQTVYSGKLADIEGLKEFQPKVTSAFLSVEAFKARHIDDTGSLRVPGVVYAGPQNWTIDRHLQADNGGIIIVGGDIVIKAGITASEPLTLVSTGNITVDTGQRVEAHLVCLRGTFRAPGRLDLVGGLAAREVDFRALLNPQPKTITWRPQDCPFRKSAASDGSLYRYQVSLQEEFYVEPGN